MKSLEQYIEETQDFNKKWNKPAIGVLKVLLWCAKNNKCITYTELNAVLFERGYTETNYSGSALSHLGKPAGIIGGYLQELNQKFYKEFPPINSLLVGKYSKIPGDGIDWFIENYLEEKLLDGFYDLSRSGKIDFYKKYIWNKVYDYDWEEIIKINEIKRLVKPIFGKEEKKNKEQIIEKNSF